MELRKYHFRDVTKMIMRRSDYLAAGESVVPFAGNAGSLTGAAAGIFAPEENSRKQQRKKRKE